ncbi:MAG: hypothetical protein K6D59_06910, partial [Bacteroidales bacterium]|nr:hypothetical protein [Bacteroidales bacterium]
TTSTATPATATGNSLSFSSYFLNDFSFQPRKNTDLPRINNTLPQTFLPENGTHPAINPTFYNDISSISVKLLYICDIKPRP